MTEESTATARILAVDDGKGIRDVVTDGLTRAGYRCLAVDSVAAAQDVLGEQAFDLLLLDIAMPVRSGMDYLPELISQHPDLAVVMLTGEADVATSVRAMREGAYDYILKPVGLADLIIRIEHALLKRSLRLESKEHQRKREELADELNTLLRERRREVEALDTLFQSEVGKSEAAQQAYSRLKESLAEFTSRLEGLVSVVGMSGKDLDDSGAAYRVKRVKVD